MKKLICILLAICCLCSVSLAEEINPFAPFVLTLPDGAALEEREGTYTIVHDMTRVVVIVIDRVPDADPPAAIIRLMTQFEPLAIIGEDLVLAEGFTGLTSLKEDPAGKAADQVNIMVLSDKGDLLILSGYDMNGDRDQLQQLLDAILKDATVDGASIVPTEE